MWLLLLSIPFVFLVGFFLACSFALADVARLKAEIKQYKKDTQE